MKKVFSMKTALITLFVVSLTSILSLTGCGSGSSGGDSGTEVFPKFVDENNNGINDYVEENTHFSAQTAAYASGPGLYNHVFLDSDHDGICDYAQNCSKTWHGPGFIDNDHNSICDYWDENSPSHNQHEGMRFEDHNHNKVNDYCEHKWHEGCGHDFVDNDGDGICDHAQDGVNTWHGPECIDDNGDGICDHWQPGGNGYGHHQHHE
jgi:hypothetical protein